MSIYLVGAPFWRVKIHWLLLGCNHERASLADYSDAGCMERGAGWKQRENEGKQGGWTSRAQLGGFLYHTEGRLVGREQNSLNHTFDSQNFCDRSPGGRDPFGNGLCLHAILRLWSKWTGIHWDTALWSEGRRESTAVRNLEVWGLAKESPRDSRCREQGVSRVDLQARWVFNDREE